MSYNIKTIYPKEESFQENTATERSFKEFRDELTTDDVMKQYSQFLTMGYSVAVSFLPPAVDEVGNEQDPFAIANKFELAGIPYKATLKLDAKGDYESMLKVTKLIEQQDYDYDVTGKLNIRENSSVDFEKPTSWFDTDYTKYTILPKAASQDIMDLKSLYDSLVEINQKVTINVKAKVKKDDDESFELQLESYPSGTEIIFKLSDSKIYGE